MRPALRLLALLALAACAPLRDRQLGQPGLEAAIRRHYAAYAVERNGACTLPRIQTITAVTKVRESADELVIDVRYRYAPDIGDSSGDDGNWIYCSQWATRRFTLSRQGGGRAIVTMDGEQRGVLR
jgi:hypothetical protein